MSRKGRYLDDPHQQSYNYFEQNSTYFHNTGVDDSYVDASDPEKLIQCPYDKNHKIRACRFPYHLVKCGKNHPDIVKQLVTCPFNARHQIPREEISQHILVCDDKGCIEQDIVSLADNQRKVNITSWQSPPCEEDWDKDLENQSHSVFIWGTSCHAAISSGSNTTMACRSHLNGALRAPRNLPFILPWKKNAGN